MKKGFTLIELLIVMAVIAILIGIAIPAFRGMQDEANRTKAEGDVRVLKIAVESYYKNHSNTYPAVGATTWENALTGAYPRILEAVLYDPFAGTGSDTYYVYSLSTNLRYYIIYSVGPQTTGTASVSITGTVSAENDAVWTSNGHL